jgi:CRP-like cAMP-binding protein
MYDSNRLVLRDSKIFYQNFSQEVLNKTVSIIKECQYSPDQPIYHEGDQNDFSIYFILKGSV